MIKFDCRDSVDDCFTSVLTHFLKRDQPPPTWSDLVTALQSPPVNQPQLVSKIRKLASSINKVSSFVVICGAYLSVCDFKLFTAPHTGVSCRLHWTHCDLL